MSGNSIVDLGGGRYQVMVPPLLVHRSQPLTINLNAVTEPRIRAQILATFDALVDGAKGDWHTAMALRYVASRYASREMNFLPTVSNIDLLSGRES